MRNIISTATACLITLSFSSNAALISTDWNISGDNLITRDSISGLDWLDLTETNNLSYNDVYAQLNVDGLFKGFRYATNAEVVNLWDHFGIDLRSNATKSVVGKNSGVVLAAKFLGNNTYTPSPTSYDYLVVGRTSETHPWQGRNRHWAMGGRIKTKTNGWIETSYHLDSSVLFDDSVPSSANGSYLVRETVVPVPAAVWLFGSGLIGLVAFARRRA